MFYIRKRNDTAQNVQFNSIIRANAMRNSMWQKELSSCPGGFFQSINCIVFALVTRLFTGLIRIFRRHFASFSINNTDCFRHTLLDSTCLIQSKLLRVSYFLNARRYANRQFFQHIIVVVGGLLKTLIFQKPSNSIVESVLILYYVSNRNALFIIKQCIIIHLFNFQTINCNFSFI